MQKRGFTLLEILIVVIILASVLAFAFPAYKRTQDRNLYTAATGVLLDLGNAVQNFQTDLATFGNTTSFPSTCEKTQDDWQHPSAGTAPVYDDAHFVDLHDMQAVSFPYALFARNYIQPIPYDYCTLAYSTCGSSDACVYKGYIFYLCPVNGSSSDACCDVDTVACMQLSPDVTRATGGLYKGARYLRDGTLEQISE